MIKRLAIAIYIKPNYVGVHRYLRPKPGVANYSHTYHNNPTPASLQRLHTLLHSALEQHPKTHKVRLNGFELTPVVNVYKYTRR